MGLLGGSIRKGSWWLSSKKDPKWNCQGYGYVGGFIMPPEAKDEIEKLKKEFGEPPDDLEWGYMKD